MIWHIGLYNTIRMFFLLGGLSLFLVACGSGDVNNNIDSGSSHDTDNVSPNPVLNTPAGLISNISPIPFHLNFGETVSGFALSDITISGGVLADLLDQGNGLFIFNLIPISKGLINISMAANQVQDDSGNNNTASNSLNIVYDITPPVVNLSSTASDPTSISPLIVDIDFGESVSGLSLDKIIVGNGVASNLVAIDGRNYQLEITPVANGVVQVSLAAGVAQDAASNANLASNSFSISYQPVDVLSQQWSDPATWGGSLPVAGENVTIPADKAIVLDISPPALAGLTIQGSLTFADQDINLSSDWIIVQGGLHIGSESSPYTSNAVITLTGDDPAENDTTRGIIVMGGMGGELQLHGSAPATIWTKIDGHIAPNASQLTVLQAEGWKAGDQIILAPTDYYGVAQTEQLTLTAVSDTQLTLGSPVQNARWGLLQYVTSAGMALSPDTSVTPPSTEGDTPMVLDQRAEVANLTRNIVIQSVDDTLWQSNGFGAHLMVMDGLNAIVRIDGVEFRRSGQAGILARYPVHWHRASYDAAGTLLGDVEGHYVRNSSIHDSANRCVTIHATNGVQFQNNICYDILGHAIFFEDAVERRNLIENNIVMRVRNPTAANALKLHDTNAQDFANGSSGIWAANPDNTIRNNVLLDAQGFGLWMAFPNAPSGPSAVVDMRPNRLRFGDFDGNTMHSNRSRGVMFDRFAIDDDGNTAEGQYFSSNDEGANTTYPFDNFRPFTITGWKLWKNQGSGNFWDRVFWPNFVAFVSADSEGKFFSGSGARGLITRSLLVGTSLNNANDTRNYPPTAFATYHSAFDMRENIVVNFPAVAGKTSGAFATDDYYIRGVEKGHIRNPNNLFINTVPGFRSDPATAENLPFNFAQGFTHYVFSGALWDPNGIWGTAGNWNVYNLPFLTHGATCTPIQNPGPENHPGASSCDGTYYGLDQFILDKGNAYYYDLMAIDVTRYVDNPKFLS